MSLLPASRNLWLVTSPRWELHRKEGFFVKSLLNFSQTLPNLVLVPDELDSHIVKIQFILLGHLVQVRVACFAKHVAVLAHLDALQPIVYGRLVGVFHFGRPGKVIHVLTHWSEARGR